MAVLQHTLFLFSFLSVFAALFFLSSFLGQKLRENGYDISKLILYGLPASSHPPQHTVSQIMAASAPSFLQNISQSDLTRPLALALAGLSTVFVYYRFSNSKRKPALDANEWKSFPLKEKIIVSPNTAIYRFELPHPQDVLGLPTGQHISVSAEIGGKNIIRSYTPTTNDEDQGHFDLLIKAYEKGNISRYISLLKIGDNIRIKGPKGQFSYNPQLSRAIGMIAGGTGITPMIQILKISLKNPSDRTKFSLIYANVSPEDILLKEELDSLAAEHPDRFTVYYVLNNPPPNWKGGVGFVSKEHVQTHLPAVSDDIKILLCGPPPMMTAMKKHLDELKYQAPRTVSKLVDQVFLF